MSESIVARFWTFPLECGGNDSITASYTFGLGIDNPLMMYRNSKNYYYVKDGLGSVSSLTDSTASVVKKYKYSVFGEILNETGVGVLNPFTYTSREYDAEMGNYFYRARYFDARLGRFLSEDPLFNDPVYQQITSSIAEHATAGRAVLNADLDLDGLLMENSISDEGQLQREYLDSDVNGFQPVLLGGLERNPYAYVVNGPVNYVDPKGEFWGPVIKYGPKVIKFVKQIRCKKVEFHPAHHSFFGKKMCHIQLNCWLKGAKGSSFTIRIPVPCCGKK